MSQFGLIYRSEWLMMDDTNTVTVNLFRTDVIIDDADTPVVIPMKGGANPLIISVVDNDRSKYKVFRSKSAKIEILTENTIDITTFTGGPDNLWRVECDLNGDNLFTGYLVTADISQNFLPHQQTLLLTAVDGLGLIKDISLTTFELNNPTGQNRLIDYLAWALSKTGLELPIWVVNNLRHWTTEATEGHFYDIIYIDAKTFEKEISESEDANAVISKILGYDCFITQYFGKWWIVRVDEYDENDIYVTVFDYLGVFQANEPPTTYNYSIGAAETTKFALADAIINRERELNFAKFVYNLEFPLEVPCNIDFSRGDYIADISATEKSYELDCWTLREGVPGFYGTVDGTTATIHRIFNSINYEQKRYIVLTPRSAFENSSINAATYIESEAIPINESDRFTGSVDFRCSTDISTGGNGNARLFRFVLEGDDGSWWILGETSTGSGEYKWWDTVNWTSNSAKGDTSVDFDEDDTQWRTISWEAPPAPVGGNIYIWLNQFNQLNSSDDNVEVWYTNLSFEYTPYINQTHSKYTGQYHKVSRTATGYLNKLEDEVFISDSPIRLAKGALHYFDEPNYRLTNKFWAGNVYPSGPPDESYTHPYGELQARSMWNQGVYPNWILSGSIYPIGPSWPDIIHKYIFTDTHAATLDRYYLMVSFDQNWKTGIMNAVMIEVYDRILLKRYDDPHEFKYITNG